jgi:hypothetical protein
MSFSERPPLDAYTCEKIDSELHKFDELHWPQITAMRVKSFFPPDEPVPPQQPEHLLREIKWYAERLFKVEADYYDPFRSDIRYGGWLTSLANRVRERVMKALEKLETSDTNALHKFVGVTGGLILGYHGLTESRIEEILMAVLTDQRLQYERGTSESQRGAATVAAAYAKAGIDLSSGSPLLLMAHATRVAAQGTKAMPAVRQRVSASVHSPGAALKMEAYMKAKGLGQTEFAIQANTTDKTIRKFRQTGSIKRSILADIARAMGSTKEELLSQ